MVIHALDQPDGPAKDALLQAWARGGSHGR